MGLAEIQSRIATIHAQAATLTRPAPRAAVQDWTAVATAAGLAPASAPAASTGSGAGQVSGGAATAQSTPASRVTQTPWTPQLPGLSPVSEGPEVTAGGEAAVLAAARDYLGVPYRWGGTDPATGLDCSGFTQLVYRRQGVELPRVSSQQATAGTAVASLAEARPGDLLFFDYSADRPGIDHVGIYQGEGKMIAAPQPGDVVKVQSAGTPSIIRRVLPTTPS